MGTITYENGKGHPSDPTDELEACLEVLGEYVDNTPTDDPALYDSEFLTACWQTVELVTRLFHTHQEMLDRMDQMVVTYRQLVEELNKGKQLIVAGKGAVPNIRSLSLPR
jgi:hypothetical protein